MALDVAEKAEIISQNRLSNDDTGSVEVQVALLTARIQQLTEHMQRNNKKDFHSRRGLVKLVSRRRRLLKYLQRTAISRYSALIEKLGIRG